MADKWLAIMFVGVAWAIATAVSVSQMYSAKVDIARAKHSPCLEEKVK